MIAYLLLGSKDRLRECEKRESEIEKRVFVILGINLVPGAALVANHLVQLQTHETHNGCGRGGNGRYYFAGNALALVFVRLFDLVVACSQVGAGGDKVHVVVAVVILGMQSKD